MKILFNLWVIKPKPNGCMRQQIVATKKGWLTIFQRDKYHGCETTAGDTSLFVR